MGFKQEILKMLEKYRSELEEGFLQDAWEGHIGKVEYGQFESYLAYCLVREYRPMRIVEIGCASGFSSYPLVLAVEKNKYGHLYSYESNEKRQLEYNTNMERLGLYWEHCSVWGDARTELINQIQAFDEYPHNTEKYPMDILFMDADHGGEFAKWYLKELVPRTSKLLHIHDIYYGHPPNVEAVEVLAWLERNPQYEWVKTMDISNDFGMDKVLDNDPVGSKNSGIWVKLRE